MKRIWKSLLAMLICLTMAMDGQAISIFASDNMNSKITTEPETSTEFATPVTDIAVEQEIEDSQRKSQEDSFIPEEETGEEDLFDDSVDEEYTAENNDTDEITTDEDDEEFLYQDEQEQDTQDAPFTVTKNAAYIKVFNWNGTGVLTNKKNSIYWKQDDGNTKIYPDAVTDAGVYIFYNFFVYDECPGSWYIYMDDVKYEGTSVGRRVNSPGDSLPHYGPGYDSGDYQEYCDSFFTAKSLSAYCPGNNYDSTKWHRYHSRESWADDYGEVHSYEMIYCAYIEEPFEVEWYGKNGTKLLHRWCGGHQYEGNDIIVTANSSNHSRQKCRPRYNESRFNYNAKKVFMNDGLYTDIYKLNSASKWKRGNSGDIITKIDCTSFYITSYAKNPSGDYFSVPVDTLTEHPIKWYEYDPNPGPTVTFDVNGSGATCNLASKTVTVGLTYGDLPEPKRTGYSFVGWYTDKNNGTKVTATTKVTNTNNHTLYAHWSASQMNVLFNANGGSLGSQTKLIAKYGQAYGTLPTPSRNGYDFLGWYNALNGGDKITSSTIVNTIGDHTLYAHWAGKQISVQLNANGGTIGSTKLTVRFGEAYGDLPVPKKSGSEFLGWYTLKDGGVEVTSTTIVNTTANHTLYAHWTGKGVKVRLDANGGSLDSATQFTVRCGEAYGVLPTPRMDKSRFLGWYTLRDGGTLITATTIVSKDTDHTIYAHWEDIFEHWGFANTEANFGLPANGYMITAPDYYRLLSNLPESEKSQLAFSYNVDGNNPAGNGWGGSCYGMSASTLMINDEYDVISDYRLGESVRRLNDIEEADPIYKHNGKDTVGQAESVINYFHLQQMLPGYQDVRSRYGNYTKAKQTEEIAKLAKNAEESQCPAVVDLWWWDNGRIIGHSINAIGYRELTPTESLYATYPHCIMTFDCSYPELRGNNSGANIYFNDAGEWVVPVWNITPANAYMLCGSADPQVVAPVDYRTGLYTPRVIRMPQSIAYNVDNGAWNLKWDDNEVNFDGVQTIETITNDDNITVIPEMTDQIEQRYRVYIPEDKDYQINGDVIDHTVYMDDQVIKVAVADDDGARVEVKQNGEVKATSENDQPIKIEIIRESNDDEIPGHVIVSTDDAGELIGQITDDGLIIQGSNLSDLTIESDNIKVTIHSDEERIMIVQNEEGTIDVFEDRDKDGTYNDLVEKEAIGFSHAPIPVQTYTGKAIIPPMQIYYEDRLLKEKKDYTIKCSNNINAGTNAMITITGKGDFGGTETETFTIRAKNISDPDVEVSDIASIIYNAKKTYTPVPSIKYNKKKLTKKDFTVAYYTNPTCRGGSVTPQDVGSYWAKVTGVGNYEGSVVIPFAIGASSKVPISKLTIGKIPDQQYNGTRKMPKPLVKNGGTGLIEGTHYTLSWGDNTEIGIGKVIIEGKDPYFGTKTVTFKITGTPMNKVKVMGFVSSVPYDGDAKVQNGIELSYKAPGSAVVTPISFKTEAEYKTLNAAAKKNVGCIVSYKNNVNAGTATMTLTGINGCSGTVNKTFKIMPYDISVTKDEGNLFTVDAGAEPYAFAKGGTKPKPIVKFKNKVLKEGTDYTLAYSNNTAVNNGGGNKKPTITVTGKGNFKGKDASATFTIGVADMTASGVRVIANDVVYTDKPGNWKSKITLAGPDGKSLKAKTDYDEATIRFTKDAAGEIEIDPNERLIAGETVYVKVNAIGTSYTGIATGSYRIVAKDIGKLTATVDAKTFTGKAVKLDPDDITWKSGGKPVDDVEIMIDESSYKNNVAKGTASVVVRGTGNYGGSKTISFKIGANGFKWWWNSLFH
ncbi:MAG: InlB B-repeat-containing protein [Lachnospiraceae bacterium]|nr:InlB B-repeat-containing protein [Lachnospiraceae bacterium]